MTTGLWLMAALAALLLCAQPSGWWCLAGAVICVACLVMAHRSEVPAPIPAGRGRDPESASPCRGVGTPRQAAGTFLAGRPVTAARALRLVATVLLIAAVLVLTSACEPNDDGTTPRDCGETSAHCDGQSP